MLTSYNKNKVPNAFGLQNTGVLCYFNSLIQCLAGCPSFLEALENDDSPIAVEYKSILEYGFENINGVTSSYNLAYIINLERLKRNYQWNISPHRQEDIHEGFILMMEILGKYDYIFSTRYTNVLYCFNCNNKIIGSKTSCPIELVIEIPYNEFTTQEEYEEYITAHYNTPEDYRCENCNYKNSNSRPKIFQRYKIARLSSVIVLLFKYNQQNLLNSNNRKNQWFPNRLKFKAKNGQLNYILVSQAEQYGSLGGGHYTATSLRSKIFNFNDSSVSPSSFNSSPNTYVLFYHLVDS